MKSKILFFANTDWYLYNFRLSLIAKMRDEGWDVALVSPSGKYGPKLQDMGFRWIPFDFSTGSKKPFGEISIIRRLVTLYRKEQPDLCHHFTVKCVLYGSIAARFCKAEGVVNSVTGMGHVFLDRGVMAKLVRSIVITLYRSVLSSPVVRVIFQNSQDMGYFVDNRIVDKNRVWLIRGAGVDTTHFLPVKREQGGRTAGISVVFASRLIREKGLYELVEAVSILNEKGLHVNLIIAGELYPGNPSSLTAEEIDVLAKVDWITYIGHVDDVRVLLARSDLVALPSYREGTPRILIEAAAMEIPIIATDIAGCRGLVVEGKNGSLVPVRDVSALARAIENLIENEALRFQMGREGRRIVLQEFDEKIVIDRTLACYCELVRL